MHTSPGSPNGNLHQSGVPYDVNDGCARTIGLHNLHRSAKASDCGVIRVADFSSHLVFTINNRIFFDVGFLHKTLRVSALKFQ